MIHLEILGILFYKTEKERYKDAVLGIEIWVLNYFIIILNILLHHFYH